MKKEFHDEKTGVVHDSDCPRTKKEFGEEGGGECPGETFVKQILAALPAPPDLESLKGREVTVTIGPAKVNSRAFRDGHDRIFGTKPTVGEA
jgi:hypothetical protein